VIWLVTCGLAVALGLVVVLAVARGEAMQPVEPDRRDVLVPADRPLHAGDLADVRFTTALRGYRMEEVDALLARLRLQLPDPAVEAHPGPATEPEEPNAG
jgi:DivIVA domain-containing protein